MALNALYAKKEKINPAYVSKQNSNREKQVTFLMILNREGWNYFSVEKLSAFLREISSKNSVDFYCLNCLHSFRTSKKFLNHIKKYAQIKVFVI